MAYTCEPTAILGKFIDVWRVDFTSVTPNI